MKRAIVASRLRKWASWFALIATPATTSRAEAPVNNAGGTVYVQTVGAVLQYQHHGAPEADALLVGTACKALGKEDDLHLRVNCDGHEGSILGASVGKDKPSFDQLMKLARTAPTTTERLNAALGASSLRLDDVQARGAVRQAFLDEYFAHDMPLKDPDFDQECPSHDAGLCLDKAYGQLRCDPVAVRGDRALCIHLEDNTLDRLNVQLIRLSWKDTGHSRLAFDKDPTFYIQHGGRLIQTALGDVTLGPLELKPRPTEPLSRLAPMSVSASPSNSTDAGAAP